MFEMHENNETFFHPEKKTREYESPFHSQSRE